VDIEENTPLLTGKTRRWQRLAAITGAGVLVGMMAVAAGGVASAQTVVDVDEPEPKTLITTHALQADTELDGDVEGDRGGLAIEEFTPSAEDEAIFEQYEQCLSEAGVDFESNPAIDLGTVNELDEATLDAAFGTCDPILDGLSEEFAMFDEIVELSPEDEAIFERFDACLDDGGIDTLFDAASDASIDDAAIDALFDSCDPVLDSLSEDAQSLFEDCPEDDAHLNAAAD